MAVLPAEIELTDIDELLELFGQLKSFVPDLPLPSKDETLWQRCISEAEQELLKKARAEAKRLRVREKKARRQAAAASGLGGPGSYISTGRNEVKKIKTQKPTESEIKRRAEEKYFEKDENYRKACADVGAEKEDIKKAIAHKLYTVREPLLKFDIAKGTLLVADWQKIRQDVLQEISVVSEKSIDIAIDALEAIRKAVAASGGKAGTQATPETEHENKVVQENQEGVLEPKPPEFLQKLLWICRYGRRHWKLVLLAILILLFLNIFVLPKFDLFSEIYRLIKNIHF
jgi:hypothetical protein